VIFTLCIRGERRLARSSKSFGVVRSLAPPDAMRCSESRRRIATGGERGEGGRSNGERATSGLFTTVMEGWKGSRARDIRGLQDKRTSFSIAVRPYALAGWNVARTAPSGNLYELYSEL